MEIRLLREVPDDAKLREEWDELVLRTERPEVFYTYEWALAVARAYGDCRRPLLALGYKQKRLVGAASLYVARDGLEAGFLSSTTADYCDFVCAPEDRNEFLVESLRTIRESGVAELILANLPAESEESVVRAQRRCGYHVFSRPAYDCAQVALTSPEEKRAATNQLETKGSLRRIAKKLNAAGNVRLQHTKGEDWLGATLPSFYRKHVARFLMMGKESNLIDPARRNFLDELARLLSRSGWMKFSFLSIGEQQIAWNYGFQFANSWFWYQPTFDTTFQKYFPGLSLLIRIVEEAAKNSEIERVDLGLGAEGYKERVSTRIVKTAHITASRSLVSHVRHRLRHFAAALVKKFPRIERLMRAALSKRVRIGSRIDLKHPHNTVRWLISRLRDAWQREVAFFEWNPNRESAGSFSDDMLQPVDLDKLANAAMKHGNDAGTMSFLKRSGLRLSSTQARGFLWGAPDDPVHFCWVTDFEGFYVDELRRKMYTPARNSVLIYDCWTVPSARGKGAYSKAITALGELLNAEGKNVWIFSAVSNVASIRGIEKSGFVHRYSIRKSLFGLIVRRKPNTIATDFELNERAPSAA